MSANKKLVAYFSASGVTRKAAEALAKAIEADIYEIKPQIPYTRVDLDWTNKKSRTTKEMEDSTLRPAIADKDANIGAYDVIFVGYPIWWYVAPTIIHTFLESYDFAGKTIVPFATSSSSDIGEPVKYLQSSVDASTTILPGEVLVRQTKRNLTAWVKSLGV